MATQKQISANRRNAQKSTGATSDKGKAVASMNALKHGFRSERVVIRGENREELDALYHKLAEHYQPVGPVEEDLVEQIAECTWRRWRATLFETCIMHREWYEADKEWARVEMARNSDIPLIWHSNSAHTPRPRPPKKTEEKDEDPAKQQAYKEAEKVYDAADEQLRTPLANLAVVFLRSAEDLEKLARYIARNDRQLRNAIRDLEELQARRKSESADAARVIEGTAVDQTESERDSSGSDSPNSATKGEVQEANQLEKYELRRRRVAAWQQKNAKEVA